MDEALSSGVVRGPAGLRVAQVRFGDPARRALAEFVAAAKARDALAPVTVVVPSNYTGLALRRALAAGLHGGPGRAWTGLAALETITLDGLAERLAGASLQAAGMLPLSGLMTAAAIRSVLRNHSGQFAAVASHHQTSEALRGAYGELRDLSAGQLALLRAASDRARGVVDICEQVRSVLRGRWYDAVDLLVEATRLVEGHGQAGAADDGPWAASVLDELGSVAVYLPRRLSQNAAHLVRALGRRAARRSAADMADTYASAGGGDSSEITGSHGGSEILLLLGVTGNRHADAGARVTAERLGVQLSLSPTEADDDAPCRIMSVTDPDEEVRTVVREVVADLDGGVPPQRIAVFYEANEPYGRTFEEQFEAAGVDTYGSTARTLAESIYGRFALGLAALADAGLAATRLERRDVFDLLAGAKVPRLAERVRVEGQYFVPDSKWERLARAARVVGGHDWSLRLGHHAEDLRARANGERSGSDPSDAFARRLRDEARECEALSAFIDELRGHLEDGRSRTTWPRLCDWIRGLLHRYLGQVGRHPWTDEWPHWERTAAERVEGILDRLAELSAFEPRVDLGVMAHALEGELAQPHGRSGTEGSGVYVGPLIGAVDVAPERVYIVGAAEGILPARPQPDSLITAEERQALGGALARQADSTADQHRIVLAAQAGASGRCTFLAPRGDLRRSSEYVPSRWLADVAQRLERAAGGSYFSGGYVGAEEIRAAALDPDIAGISEVPSYLTGVRAAAFPATRTEFDSARLLRGPARLEAEGAAPFDEPGFVAGIEMERSRASSRFTRFDGNLARVIDRADAMAQTVAATRLEAWAGCPRRYLFEHLLGVRAVEEPEQILRLGPLERGQLMHEAIDRFLAPLIAARDSAAGHVDGTARVPPGPSRPPSDEDRSELTAIGSALADEFERRGLVGHRLLWERDRAALLSDLGQLLDRDEEREAATRGDVVASEFRFGFDGTPDAVEYRLADGEAVRFRGVIDRVERTADGGLVVVDYKTGSFSRHRTAVKGTRSQPPDPTGRGTMLQLPLYALAAEQHFGGGNAPAAMDAAYWFITSAPGQWTWLPLSVDDSLWARFDEVVTAVVGGIREGVFPGFARPGDDRSGYVACPYCNPDGIGTEDVVRSWRRKRSDPALAGFSQLADPTEPDAAAPAGTTDANP